MVAQLPEHDCVFMETAWSANQCVSDDALILQIAASSISNETNLNYTERILSWIETHKRFSLSAGLCKTALRGNFLPPLNKTNGTTKMHWAFLSQWWGGLGGGSDRFWIVSDSFEIVPK